MSEPFNPFAPPSAHRAPEEHAAPSAQPDSDAGPGPSAGREEAATPVQPPYPSQPTYGRPGQDRDPVPSADQAYGRPAPPPYRQPSAGTTASPAGTFLTSPAGAPPTGTPGPVDSWGRPTSPVEERPRRGLSAVWLVPLLVLAVLAGALGGVGATRLLEDDRPADAALPEPAGRADVGELTGVAAIAADVLPSVVSVEVRTAQGDGNGSGFVLREDGYILTNNHVVAAAADGQGEVVVVFADGSEESAEIVGRTSEYDLAVIKVDREDLRPLVLGDSDAVTVGDPVVAVGAPLGLQGTVTTGIVSALNRPVSAGNGDDPAFINAIQTDAAINPGNSGGPLVNVDGEVIGINSAIAQRPGATTAAGSIGLGFAIPSNQARRTAEELIETGRATYPVIGVLLDQRYVGEGVQVSAEPQNGTPPVTPDGPADRAGIRAGDIIVAIDGRPVTQADELIVALRAKAPGDAVALTVRSGDEERDVRVVLDEFTSGG